MVGATRLWGLTVLLGLLVARGPHACADDPPTNKQAKPAPIPSANPLEEPLQPFVPLHPRTVEQQRQIEAAQDYARARALEDERELPPAIDLLEKALKKDPDSVAILRSLSRLCFALGRTEPAIAYSRRVIAAEPNDTATLHRLVRYYEMRNDSESAEALLKTVLANPKLEPNSAARLLALRDLGLFYKNRLLQLDKLDKSYNEIQDKAADAFAKLVNALDQKETTRLSLADEEMILGDKPESTYLVFGTTLLEAKRYEPAILAFRRGLVYDDDQPLLRLQLARALIGAKKYDEAIQLAEQFIKEQPQLRDSYDLLARCLTALGRTGEIIPRLEALAKENPQNRAVQYALAEQYHKQGQREKANALFEQLRTNPPTPQDFAALSAWLLQEKKTDELIRLLGEAVGRRDGIEAVRPQIEAIAADPAYAEQVLDTAQKMLSDDPKSVNQNARRVLAYIANRAKKPEKLVALLRVAVQKDPTPQDYSDLIDTLSTQLNRPQEVVAAIEELLAKYPNLKSPRVLTNLGRSQLRAGKKEAAVSALREARALEPNDPEVLYYLAFALSNVGKDVEAAALVNDVLKQDPTNEDFNQLLGTIYTQAGKNEEAITHYKGLLERFANDDDLVRVAHAGLSVVYVNMEQFEKGEAELEMLYEKDPDDDGVNNDLGYLYADRGKNLEKAEQMIRKAVQDKPETSAYLDSLGWVLYKRGKVKEALEPLEKAAKLPNGSDPTIFDHLGDVYFRLHEFAKARTAWEEALRLAPDVRPPDKRVPEIRKKLESLKELDPAPRTSTQKNP